MAKAGVPGARASLMLLCLVAALLLSDLALRSVDERVSGNLAHIAEIPGIIAEVASASEPALLVIGNSLTNNGVSQPALAAALPALRVGKVTPDATAIWDWQCILDHDYIDRRDLHLDTVVIGFGWRLASDQTPPDASRLGAHYCELSDLTHPSRIGLTDAAGIGEFVSAKLFRIYGLRETLRNRLLDLFIPHYKDFAQQTNTARGGATAGTVTVAHSYRVLESLAQRLGQRGTHLVLVAMPVREPYDIDPQLRDLQLRGIVSLVDFRALDGITAGKFKDAMHLDTEGQQVLTAALATALVELRATRR